MVGEKRRHDDEVASVVELLDEENLPPQLIVAVMRYICATGTPGAILVFLAGWEDIRGRLFLEAHST
jgi:hypothetical protein